ncbi:MAG: hypothetical protein L3J93_00290 [Thermoplasmata archaeon]|nr:hypothetical protein [Thermoplasmata archaeon]
MGKEPYLGFDTPGGGRGDVRTAGPGESPSTTSYVRVEDLETARRQIEAAGGRIVLPTMELPGMGSFFWFQVPSGPVMACWQDATPP